MQAQPGRVAWPGAQHGLLASGLLPCLQAPDGGSFLPADWGQPDAEAGGGSSEPLSWEGGPQRCFRQLFVCSRGLNTTTMGWPLHGLGQRLARHYRDLALGEVAAELAAAVPAGASREERQHQLAALQRSTAAAAAAIEKGRRRRGSTGGKRQEPSGSERVLRVVLHRRSSPDRQLLNARELVARCNAWRHVTAAGQRLRAACREAPVDSLFEGLAAASEVGGAVAWDGGWADECSGCCGRPCPSGSVRAVRRCPTHAGVRPSSHTPPHPPQLQADIFVAMHGANQANGELCMTPSAARRAVP